MFVAASNRVGKDNDLLFNCHSQIISPDGKILAKIIDKTDDTAATINFNEVGIVRNRFNCLTERQTAVYSNDIKS